MPRSNTLLLWTALTVATLAVVPGCSTRTETGDRNLRAAVKQRLAVPRHFFRRTPVIDADEITPLVRRFYQSRDWRPAWANSGGPEKQAGELAASLEKAQDEGLSPEEYDVSRIRVLTDSLGKADLSAPSAAGRLADYDLLLTRNYLEYAAHRFGGEVNPQALPTDWHTVARKGDYVALLRTALEKHDVTGSLASLDPPYPGFRSLREALARQRAIMAAGGWPVIPPGPALKLGRADARLAPLRAHLVATGDLDARDGAGRRFDRALEAAVRRFQARHGLEPTGIADAATLAELNVPVSSRIRQIQLNLERWRWLPASLGDPAIIVNIPDYSLDVREGGRSALAMRVVVGKQLTRTPMFSDEVSYVVLNPYWNVPPKLAADEVLTEVQRDPRYLEKNHMKLFQGTGEDAQEVDPASVDWSKMAPEDFKFAVRQEPGPDNAVGHVKFMCPNQFDVYLHDTPAGHLFDRKERDFSHGCIRVERPDELLRYVLRDKPEWTPERIAAAYDTSRNLAVTLPKPIPVHILYWTAWVDDQGLLQFRPDVYGLDEMLDGVLRHTPGPRLVAPATETKKQAA